ncbi:MAG: valine--tRNA ligase [Candidatus Saccharibacteria bacterium]|nr:valine--tRNA ligase [Candidatus Saccharibacteria bacterium]
MSLNKIYQPNHWESIIYKKWEQAQGFQPIKTKNKKIPFVITLPPPNANANLHVGHALDFQIKDIIGRHKRLQGYEVLLLPGADHAGFETWALYEKHLNAKGQSRFDFNRDELYKQVYQFVEENRFNMENQIRQLGISCDWQKFTFTLDDKIVKSSYKIFHKMWQKDLIYRAKRLVNYCVNHGTAFADREVEYQTTETHLWHINYPLENKNTMITVATTRPETMLGDMAVAVNPKDQRYQNLIGQKVILPLTDRVIPIIADEAVKKDFGTGAVKITPGSDFLDFEIGQRHNLKILEIIDTEGKFTSAVPEKYSNHKVLETRQLVLADLEELGLLNKEEAYQNVVAHCYKCGQILEPLLKDQWFVKMGPLIQVGLKALKENKITFYPKGKKQELITYWNNLQDWNISRQIAWGIPIPVFENVEQPGQWVYDERVDQKIIQIKNQTYRRDPDVFDTWWSSSQWPYASLDYQKNPQYYPTSLMETGVDLLRAWVSRMILLSLFVTQEIPFKDVYLHGMVVDERGVKMSKSMGNVINPIDMVGQYGSDALRLALISGVTPGQPQPFGLSKMTMGRNFCNKLWNIGRYIQTIAQTTSLSADIKTPAEAWILKRLYDTCQETDKQLQAYRLNLAWDSIYKFIWHDLADWFLEISKNQPNNNLLHYIFLATLKLVHPWTPFVSEVLYQELYANKKQPLLITYTEEMPRLTYDPVDAEIFIDVQKFIIDVRQLLELNLRKQTSLYLKSDDFEIHQSTMDSIQQLTQIRIVKLAETDAQGLNLQQSKLQGWLQLPLNLLKHKHRELNQELNKQQRLMQQLQQRLDNPLYLTKAPKSLIKESSLHLKETTERCQLINRQLQQLRQALKTID